MPAGDYASSRYSELSDITPANASQLKAAWTFSTGVLRGHEGQPLVIDNTMYLVTPYPNVAYAIDLTQPGYPLKWKFRPENDDRATGKACCDVVNRGASFANGLLVYNLLDGHTVAVDANNGAQRWRTKVVDVATGETITMAPIIVKDLVIVGSSGGEMGVRGFVAALDLATGKERWRAWNVGPDVDVKVGPRYAPFYEQDKGKELAVTTIVSKFPAFATAAFNRRASAGESARTARASIRVRRCATCWSTRARPPSSATSARWCSPAHSRWTSKRRCVGSASSRSA